jgi:hypothetical protein
MFPSSSLLSFLQSHLGVLFQCDFQSSLEHRDLGFLPSEDVEEFVSFAAELFDEGLEGSSSDVGDSSPLLFLP